MNSKVCHCCFGEGILKNEGYAECPYCNCSGFEEDEKEGEEEGEEEYDYKDDVEYIHKNHRTR